MVALTRETCVWTVEMNGKMDDVMDGGEEGVLLPRGVGSTGDRFEFST